MGGGEEEKRTPLRFRFIVAQATESSFKKMIKANWSKEDSWPKAISSLTERIKEWNNTVFGNINNKKRTLSKRLNGIDKTNPKGANPYLNQLQERLWKDYEKTLLQEKILWSQRARHKWLHFGDKNTRFSHASMVVKKKRNRVEALRDDMDKWVMDKTELKRMATIFFKKLYSKEDQVDVNTYPFKGFLPKLDSLSLKNIDDKVTYEEIKDALFSMGAVKAPGLEGFHAIFFQRHYWGLCLQVY